MPASRTNAYIPQNPVSEYRLFYEGGSGNAAGAPTVLAEAGFIVRETANFTLFPALVTCDTLLEVSRFDP